MCTNPQTVKYDHPVSFPWVALIRKHVIQQTIQILTPLLCKVGFRSWIVSPQPEHLNPRP